jgi:hypothetical protein
MYDRCVPHDVKRHVYSVKGIISSGTGGLANQRASMSASVGVRGRHVLIGGGDPSGMAWQTRRYSTKRCTMYVEP